MLGTEFLGKETEYLLSFYWIWTDHKSFHLLNSGSKTTCLTSYNQTTDKFTAKFGLRFQEERVTGGRQISVILPLWTLKIQYISFSLM